MTWRKVTHLELANVTMGANIERRVRDIEAQYGTGGLTSCGNLWNMAKEISWWAGVFFSCHADVARLKFSPDAITKRRPLRATR